MYKMTKKEIKLNVMYGKKWDVIIKHVITISVQDSENIIKCNEKLIEYNAVCLKRITRKIKVFDRYIYINTLYGELDEKNN